VLGRGYGMTVIAGGGGGLWQVGFSVEVRKCCWGIWCVYHSTGCCSHILHKCKNARLCVGFQNLNCIVYGAK
jgi:hypothetical protein